MSDPTAPRPDPLAARLLGLTREAVALFDGAGRITLANSRFAELVGADPAGLAGRDVLDALAPVLGPGLRDKVVGMLADPRSADDEEQVPFSLGRDEFQLRVHPVDAPGHKSAVVIADDEEANYQKTLYKIFKEKEGYRKRLEAVFNSVPDHIVSVDAEMRVIMANRLSEPFCPALGNRSLGQRFCSRGCCEQSPCLKVIEQTIATRRGITGYQAVCTAEGTERTVELSSAPLLHEGKQFLGAVLTVRDITRLAALERSAQPRKGLHNIIGASNAMQVVFRRIEQLKDLNITVLLTGESGTGKELVAEALHHKGVRGDGPMVKVNCSALAESLLESELFGHVKGAFTGAVNNRVGRIQAAEGGTLFLDEIGEISQALQVKLLRFLETKEYEPVGDSRTRTADVRLVAATNADLAALVRQGSFREDLYYRLNVFGIALPPLRERSSDIPLLARHFIRQCNKDFMKGIKGLDGRALSLLATYPWPGNVRELRHALEHACVVCLGQQIGLEHLPETLRGGTHAPTAPPLDAHHPAAQADSERQRIQRALEQAGGNRSKAARILGVHRATLYRKLAALDLG